MSKAKSSIFLSAASLLGLGLNFLALPWLIQWLGEGEWGIYIFLQTIALYVGLIDIGFTHAAIKRMAEAFGRSDREAAWQVQRCQFGAHIVLALAGFLIFAVLTFLLPFPHTSEVIQRREWLLPLVGVSFGIGALSGALAPVFIASERFGVIAIRDSVQRLISLGLGLWAAYQYGTLFAYLVASAVGTTLGFLLNFFTLKVSFEDFRLRPSLDRAIMSDLLTLGFRGYIHRIGSMLANSVHLPLMAYAGSAAMATRYQLAGRIPEALQAIVSPISQTILPQLTREASDDPATFARSVERYSMIGLGLGISLILVPAGFGKALLDLWAKDNPALTPVSSLVLLILALYFTFELFYIMLTKAFYAIGNPHFMAPFSIFNGLATLALTVPVVLNFGLVGIAVQNLCIDLAQLVPMLFVVKKRTAPDLKVWPQVLNISIALVLGSGIAIGAYSLVRVEPFESNPWLSLALVPVFSAATFFLLVAMRLVPLPQDLRKLMRKGKTATAGGSDHPA